MAAPRSTRRRRNWMRQRQACGIRGSIAAAEADVAVATASVQQCSSACATPELHAPFAGVVATLNVTEGEQVSPGGPVIQLADDTTWRLKPPT